MKRNIITERYMSSPCQVLVKVGDLVDFNSTVARATIQGELIVLPVAKRLSIEPRHLSNYLKKSLGEVIKAGEVLASFSSIWGLFSDSYSSPCAGTIEFVSEETGNVGIRASSHSQELKAYVSGVVKDAVEGRGVIIETEGTRLQGAFGIGGEQNGTIRKISVRRDEVVRFTHIPDSCEGQILFGGNGITKGAIDKAIERGAVGVVTGGLEDEIIRQYLGYEIGLAITGDESVPLTLIATEGFGSLSMSDRIHASLSNNEGVRAAINGATQVRAGAVRPEILIPEGRQDEETKEIGIEITVGSRVRILKYPLLGKEGVVTEAPVSPQKLPTEAVVRVFKVQTEDSRVQIMVPRTNLEAI